MTTQVINGVTVVEEHFPATPLPHDEGTPPIKYKQVKQLLLSDGTIVHKCVHCDFTAPKLPTVRSHVAVHKPAEQRKPRKSPQVQPPEGQFERMTVGELREMANRLEIQAARIEGLMESEATWKARALAAEKPLATLKKLLNQ